MVLPSSAPAQDQATPNSQSGWPSYQPQESPFQATSVSSDEAINQYQPPQQYQAPVQPVQPVQTQPIASSEPTPQAPAQTAQNPAPTPAADTANPNEPQYYDNPLKPQPEEVLIEWQADSRPFKNRNRKYYVTSGLIVFLISMILLFINEWLLIAVVVSVAFLAYVLHSVPPDVVTHKLTTYGVRVENKLYYWEEVGRFWITTKYDMPILHFEIARFPYRISLLLGTIPAEPMRGLLSEVLLEQQPEPTLYDKAAAWLEKKLPLDTD